MDQLISRYRRSINPPYNFKDYLNLFFTFFILLALPVGIYLSQQKQDIRQYAQGENTQADQGQQGDETVKGLTLAVLKLNGEQNQAPQDKKTEVMDRLVANLRQRQQTMADLIEQAPGAALKIGLPTSIKNQFPQDVQSTIEDETTLDGTLEVLHSDGIDANNSSQDQQFTTSRFYYYIKPDTGDRIQLFFASNPPVVLSDSKVQVHGLRLGDKMAVASSDEKDFKVLTATSNVLGTSTTKKVAVILINFQNSPTQPYTPDFARSVMFTSTTSANDYYKENSFGKMSMEGSTRVDGDIYGWYTIPYDNTTCTSYYNWASAAETAAAGNGFVRTNYTNIEYAFPNASSCGWWGLGTIGGSPGQSWINGSYALRVTAHELGHNFRTHHANTYNCTDTSGQRVSISSSCTSYEYGDPFDVMGSSTNHFNNFHKGQATFLDAANTQTISSDGDYTIVPVEQASTGVQALRIPRDVSSTGNVTNYYYLEYRRAFGFDNFSSTSPVLNGVSIRLSPDYPTIVQSQLIDTTPTTTSFSDSPLALNQTFQDSIKGIGITTQGISSASASVKVTFGPQTCARANPIVTISPLGQYGNPGQTLTYTVTVTNKDSSACSLSTFTITPALSAGFSQNPNPGSISLSPGASGNVSVSLTSDVSVIEGFYTFTETATNSSDTAFKASATANYNVIAPPPPPSPTPSPTPSSSDTTPPSASITSPSDGSIVKAPSKVTITANASDNVGVSKVEFYVGGSLKCTDTVTPYTCTWSVPGKKNTSYTISAKAYDSSNNTNITTITVRAQ